MKIKPSGKRSLMQKLGLGVKVIVALEVASLLGSYAIWKKMNTDRDFRYRIHQSAPYLLTYYYGVGETLGGVSSRDEDYRAWGIKSS